MSAETDRQENFDSQFEDFMERNPNYATPGAQRHWRKIKTGYVLLAIGCIIGIWAISNHDTNNLKSQINRSATANCISGIRIFTKYNDLVNSIIETRRESIAKDKRTHDMQQLVIDQRAVARYKKDRIVPPTVLICQRLKSLK
jgi:hypothetical protein